MKGIILISHGPMAKGVYETAQWFFGNEIEQFTYLCLQEEDKQAEFIDEIKELIIRTDTGDGVVIFTDLYGGTPCNCCIELMSDRIQLIAGMNLTIVLELLGNRLSGNDDMDELIKAGQQGMVYVNNYQVDLSDDFLD